MTPFHVRGHTQREVELMPDVGFFLFCCCHPLVICENTAYSGIKGLLKTPLPHLLYTLSRELCWKCHFCVFLCEGGK